MALREEIDGLEFIGGNSLWTRTFGLLLLPFVLLALGFGIVVNIFHGLMLGEWYEWHDEQSTSLPD